MTKLSLFLYGADVLDSLSDIFVGVGIVLCIVGFFVGIFVCMSWFNENSRDDEGCKWFRKHTVAVILVTMLAIFSSFGVSALIPEKKTMYMIAGVEMAEMFRQTDTARELSKEMKGVLSDITGIIHSYAHEHGANNQQEAK